MFGQNSNVIQRYCFRASVHGRISLSNGSTIANVVPPVHIFNDSAHIWQKKQHSSATPAQESNSEFSVYRNQEVSINSQDYRSLITESVRSMDKCCFQQSEKLVTWRLWDCRVF